MNATTNNTAGTNEPTGATYRIETLADVLALPPARLGHFITDFGMWLAFGMAARDALKDACGTVTLPAAMIWKDDGKHDGGVRVENPTTGETIMELKLDGKAFGAGPVDLSTLATTTPAPLSARLATMAEQVQGMAEALDPRLGNDIEELEDLGAALAIASQDAAALEAQIPKRDAKVARWMTDEREPDRDTDQHGNTYPTNADGGG